MSNLHSYLQSSKPVPQPVCTSQEVRDRGSIFVANVFRATNEEDARRAVTHLRNVIHGSNRATHELYAWRCMTLKAGKTGLGGPEDFQVANGCEDDGEKYGGSRILKIMQAEGIIDAVLVVSRWFGGEMLGPARFSHIETCSREVSHAFRVRDEVEECVATLKTLDDILVSLRAGLASLTQQQDVSLEPEKPVKKKQGYADLLNTLELPRAKRLITAREKAIQSVKALLKKAKDAQEQVSPETILTSS